MLGGRFRDGEITVAVDDDISDADLAAPEDPGDSGMDTVVLVIVDETPVVTS